MTPKSSLALEWSAPKGHSLGRNLQVVIHSPWSAAVQNHIFNTRAIFWNPINSAQHHFWENNLWFYQLQSLVMTILRGVYMISQITSLRCKWAWTFFVRLAILIATQKRIRFAKFWSGPDSVPSIALLWYALESKVAKAYTTSKILEPFMYCPLSRNSGRLHTVFIDKAFWLPTFIHTLLLKADQLRY